MHPFAKHRRESVSGWGEARLISAIRGWLGSASPSTPFGIGDDCAVLTPSRGRQLITVDPVIFGRHFDATIPPRGVAEKLLKRNLSDIAAMGGRPVAAVLALTLDGKTSVTWLEQFYRGLGGCARKFEVALVGGDIAQADGVFAASLTLLGEATGPRILTRVGAKAGDAIYVTGVLGGSLASGHHFRFRPRLAEGRWLARQKDVRSMMDVSDGLAKDLRALTPPHTEAALDPTALPRRSGAGVRGALCDGEDYELAFALARRSDEEKFRRDWRRAFPRTRLTRIGQFAAADRLPPGAITLGDYRGYEHLQ
ncbi:MAG: thiamine-phosphate kinase [Opitutaceae bacterium]